jgi:hypothetical protein
MFKNAGTQPSLPALTWARGPDGTPGVIEACGARRALGGTIHAGEIAHTARGARYQHVRLRLCWRSRTVIARAALLAHRLHRGAAVARRAICRACQGLLSSAQQRALGCSCNALGPQCTAPARACQQHPHGHATLPSPLFLAYSGQLLHPVLPCFSVYLPSGHLVHSKEAAASLYEPAAQSSQRRALSPLYWPASQFWHGALSPPLE